MKTILVSTDFSGTAANALEYALSMAQVIQARIVLVHVVDVVSLASVHEVDLAFLTAQIVLDVKLELQCLAEQVRTSTALEVESICRTGNLSTKINELVHLYSVDFVIMGSHGQSGMLDRTFGTNALAYMKAAQCAVLLVPHQARFKGIHQITFAYDLDSKATDVLKELFKWAAPFQAVVSILNCLSEHQLNIIPDLPLLETIFTDFSSERFNLVQRKEDDVVKGILGFVQEIQADVLAISTHERIFLEKLFHSSLSKQLLFKTEVPLLALQETPNYPKRQHLQELLHHKL